MAPVLNRSIKSLKTHRNAKNLFCFKDFMLLILSSLYNLICPSNYVAMSLLNYLDYNVLMDS